MHLITELQKHTREKMTGLKKERDKSAILAGNLNVPPSTIDRQKISNSIAFTQEPICLIYGCRYFTEQ